MVSLGNSEKRQAWTARFARYQSSGLSVARFCDQERVSVNTFYRWAKLVGSKSARPSTSTGKQPRRSRDSLEPAIAAGRSAQGAVVRFSWNAGLGNAGLGNAGLGNAGLGNAGLGNAGLGNAGLEVSVPADCLEAIRCLAECLQRARPECSDAFQEVVVRS